MRILQCPNNPFSTFLTLRCFTVREKMHWLKPMLLYSRGHQRSGFLERRMLSINLSVLIAFEQPLKITAVLDDFPPNSHLSFNLLVSLKSFAGADWYKEVSASDWSSNSFSTYVLLKNSIDANKVENAITETVNKNRDAKTPKSSFRLQPLTEIHFHSADIRGGYARNPGAIYYIYIFGAVGLFIITIACINYINLSTSLSITRGKEVGVKKVAGAGRAQLIWQFITESSLVSLAALMIAVMVIIILLPSFNAFVGKQISVRFVNGCSRDDCIAWLLPY